MLRLDSNKKCLKVLSQEVKLVLFLHTKKKFFPPQVYEIEGSFQYKLSQLSQDSCLCMLTGHLYDRKENLTRFKKLSLWPNL